MAGKLDFILLTPEESVNKVSMLSLTDEGVRIWKKNSPPYSVKCIGKATLADNGIEINFSTVEAVDEISNSELMFSFNSNGVKFFGKGNIKEVYDNSILFVMDKNIYRCEKRKNERLLTYPLYKVYSLFSFKTKENGNITYINRPSENEDKFFNVYLNNKVVTDSSKGPLSGLRVLDISKTGVSFIANLKESNFFKNGEKKEFYIEFDGTIFTSIEGTVVYVVDYIDPRFSGIRMYKVGINFTQMNPELETKINITLGKNLDSGELDSQFESFLK